MGRNLAGTGCSYRIELGRILIGINAAPVPADKGLSNRGPRHDANVRGSFPIAREASCLCRDLLLSVQALIGLGRGSLERICRLDRIRCAWRERPQRLRQPRQFARRAAADNGKCRRCLDPPAVLDEQPRCGGWSLSVQQRLL